MFISVMLISTISFANTPSLNNKSGFSKESPQLQALSSAWKSHGVAPQAQDQGDLNMVYGGKDVSREERGFPVRVTV